MTNISAPVLAVDLGVILKEYEVLIAKVYVTLAYNVIGEEG